MFGFEWQKDYSAFTISYDKIGFLNRHKIEFRLEHLFEDEHHGSLICGLTLTANCCRRFAAMQVLDLRADVWGESPETVALARLCGSRRS